MNLGKMMEFLAEYGLFLLKVLTIIVALLVAVAGILMLGRKQVKPMLEITSLNDQYEKIKYRMVHDLKKEKPKKKTKKDKKADSAKHSLYVIEFNGDIKASQVEELRDLISAILTIVNEKDEVLICLETPGGSVNGYGLAAAQLQRLRDRNIPLTVCIDKVAASGGYLMACVANQIIAAPFAIIGSIGVVAQLPNFHRWLKKNNIDFELLTAGEYKRTLTVFGENTAKGREKFQEDLEQIHKAFCSYVMANRPLLDIDKVATGEHWLAKDAYELKLVDALKTSDDYIIERMKNFNSFKLAIPRKKSKLEKLLKPVMSHLFRLPQEF